MVRRCNLDLKRFFITETVRVFTEVHIGKMRFDCIWIVSCGGRAQTGRPLDLTCDGILSLSATPSQNELSLERIRIQ